MRADATRWSVLQRVILWLLAIYGVAVLVALLLAPAWFLPAEDAVILHQYSRSLAAHGAITYYAGGPHAEGATDFGWMLLVAAAMRAGGPPTVFTAVVNGVCLILLGGALLRLARLRVTLLRVLAIAGAAGLLPQTVAAVSGFAVLPEALLLTLLVMAVVKERVGLASVAGLVLCLFRPDGVLFTVPLLVSLLWKLATRWRRFRVIAACFVAPGVLYFLWRAHYFGEWLPLPFLVKSDTSRFLGIVVLHSLRDSLKYLLLDAVLLGVLLWGRPQRRPIQPALLVSLLLVPTLFYWTMRLDQNVGDRFFFYLPLAAAILIALAWPTLQQRKRLTLLLGGAVAFVVLLLGPLLREIRSFRDYQFRSVQAIARGLGRLPTRGSLLTSEAGFLAYGSGWVSDDAWGLNTARFARHLIQPADVVSLHPDLIVLHPEVQGDCQPQAQWPQSYPGRTWEHMVRNVVIGTAEAGGYELWQLPYGSKFYRTRKHWPYGQGDQECFFVRRGSPDYAGIVALLEQQHALPASRVLVPAERR